jgi:hypothetical protein
MTFSENVVLLLAGGMLLFGLARYCYERRNYVPTAIDLMIVGAGVLLIKTYLILARLPN